MLCAVCGVRCAVCNVQCALCYVGRDTGKAVHCKHAIHCKHHHSLIMHGKHTLHPIQVLVFSIYFPRLTMMLGPHVRYVLGLKRVRSPHFICAWSQTCSLTSFPFYLLLLTNHCLLLPWANQPLVLRDWITPTLFSGAAPFPLAPLASPLAPLAG